MDKIAQLLHASIVSLFIISGLSRHVEVGSGFQKRFKDVEKRAQDGMFAQPEVH